MAPADASKCTQLKDKLKLSSDHNFTLASFCRSLLISGLALYLIFILFFNKDSACPTSDIFSSIRSIRASPKSSQSVVLDQSHPSSSSSSPTKLSHLLFGLLGSEGAWHHRKAYIEAWWRPNVTKGYLYLDKAPIGDDLLPWSPKSPPYRVSDDISKLIEETRHVAPIMARMVHGIMEVFREEHEGIRWVVMGDDDSIFFVDNMVNVLAKYDHTKYYYLGGHSEYILSNFWFHFNQGFGGAGFMLSYPLAKALANDMDSCLRRYAHVRSADTITMACIADLGVNLSPQKGIHQIDLRGDLSGFLSSHPKSPLLSLHHPDSVDPIFPSMDRSESIQHLMKAASFDQSRMLQQTICYNRLNSWTFSISWGYSAHIYEKIMTRSYLQNPIETFHPWTGHSKPPHYMLNTRWPFNDPCEAPHVFFFDSIEKSSENEIITTYSRLSPRNLSACLFSGNHSADYVSTIVVISPATPRFEIDRCECCNIDHEPDSKKAQIKFRECMVNEVIG